MGLRIRPDAADDLDSVYDGVRRRVIVLAPPLVTGLLLLTAEPATEATPTPLGDHALWAGFLVLSLASLAWVAPREVDEVAVQGDGCVLLPIRRARHVLICLWAAAVPVAALVIVLAREPDSRSGGLLVVGFVLPFVYLPARLRHDLRLRLEPRGLRLRCGDLRERFVPWAEVEDVLPDPGRSQLFLLLRGDRTVNLAVLRYQWRASSIGEVIGYFAEHPEARPELTDVRALDRFRVAAAAR